MEERTFQKPLAPWSLHWPQLDNISYLPMYVVNWSFRESFQIYKMLNSQFSTVISKVTWKTHENESPQINTVYFYFRRCEMTIQVKLNLSWIELIELIKQICVKLGIVKINSCVTSKLPIIKKNCIMIIELVADKSLLLVLNKLQCNCLQCVVL